MNNAYHHQADTESFRRRGRAYLYRLWNHWIAFQNPCPSNTACSRPAQLPKLGISFDGWRSGRWRADMLCQDTAGEFADRFSQHFPRGPSFGVMMITSRRQTITLRSYHVSEAGYWISPFLPKPSVWQDGLPKPNVYMRMRDELGVLYADDTFADFIPRAWTTRRVARLPLALITVMQFAEGLSDRQAADAVRGRIDWKYALGLDLTDPGFDASVLSEFRQRLIVGQSEMRLFETLLNRLREADLVKPRGRQRTDSTHVLAAIHTLNRLEFIGETLRHALNTLAVVEPAWLRNQVPVEWFERYGRRFEEYRLPPGRPERYALAETMGADGIRLLTALYASDAPTWLREVPAVEILRQVWVQQFYVVDDVLRWRAAEDSPRPVGSSAHPMMPKRVTVRNGRPNGLATKCISPKRVMRTCRT